MRIPTTLILVATLAATACKGGSGGSRWSGTMTDSAGVTIVSNPDAGVWGESLPAVTRELDIGVAEGDSAYQFGTIAGVDVGSDGSIYVFDQQHLTVRVFDTAGKFVRQMGRPGAGPGELGRASAGVLVNRGDTVFVPDIGQQRMVRFTRDGQDAGSFPLPLQEGISVRWAMTPEGLLVQQTRSMQPGADGAPKGDFLYLRDGAGALRDTLLQLPVGQSIQFAAGGMPRMRIFQPEPIWTLSTGGNVLYGMNSDYSIRLYNGEGQLDRIIRRPFTQSPVTESDRNALLDFMRQAMVAQGAPAPIAQRFLSTIEFAEFYPAFANLLAGIDDSIWVQRIQTAEDVAKRGGKFSAQDVGGPIWDVFDGEGRYLGPLELPDRFTPTLVRGNQVYGIWRDELDVQHVLRLRVDGTWST